MEIVTLIIRWVWQEKFKIGLLLFLLVTTGLIIMASIGPALTWVGFKTLAIFLVLIGLVKLAMNLAGSLIPSRSRLAMLLLALTGSRKSKQEN